MEEPNAILLRKYDCVSGFLWGVTSTPAPPAARGGLCSLFFTTVARDLRGVFPPRTAAVVWASDGHLYSQVYDVFLAPAINYFFFSLELLETFPVPGLFIRMIVIFLPLKRGKYLFFPYYLLACMVVRGTVPGRGTWLWAALGKHSRNDSDSPITER